MTLFPIFADLKGRRVLVVGGGTVALRKINALLTAQASITVSALHACTEIEALHQQGKLNLRTGCFIPALLEDTWLVVAATSDVALNRTVASEAERRRIFANVVDDSELCSFHVPSIVDRSPLLIAISSGGYAPMLARRVRERLECLLHPSLGRLAALLAPWRPAIRKARSSMRSRREFYDWLLDGPVAQAVYRQQPDIAAAALESALRTPAQSPVGRVIMVGAGPGDAGLLTLHGLRALNEADVILYDRLVSTDVRKLARRDAEQIDVGKRPGEAHDETQQRIHRLMHNHARDGKVVVRLKGGDAFVFGRGGEELEFLRAHDIAYSVVPGITAAFAAAAYAGVPLTHRDHCSSLQVVSASNREGSPGPDWSALATNSSTLAFYMGAGRLRNIADQLLRHGLEPDTPFALVEHASTPEQKVRYGRVDEIDTMACLEPPVSPAMLLVGKVTALGPNLQWFGNPAESVGATIEHFETMAPTPLFS